MIPMQRQMQDFSSNKDTMVKRGKLGKSQSLILPSVGKAKTKLLPQVAPEPKKFESAWVSSYSDDPKDIAATVKARGDKLVRKDELERLVNSWPTTEDWWRNQLTWLGYTIEEPEPVVEEPQKKWLMQTAIWGQIVPREVTDFAAWTVWGIPESLFNAGKFWYKNTFWLLDKAIESVWGGKNFSDKWAEKRVKNFVGDLYKKSWVAPDSASTKAGEFVGDLVTSIALTRNIAWGVSKAPVIANMATKYPRLASVAKVGWLSLEGVVDADVFSQLSRGEQATAEERVIWWVAAPLVGLWLNKFAKKIASPASIKYAAIEWAETTAEKNKLILEAIESQDKKRKQMLEWASPRSTTKNLRKALSNDGITSLSDSFLWWVQWWDIIPTEKVMRAVDLVADSWKKVTDPISFNRALGEILETEWWSLAENLKTLRMGNMLWEKNTIISSMDNLGGDIDDLVQELSPSEVKKVKAITNSVERAKDANELRNIRKAWDSWFNDVMKWTTDPSTANLRKTRKVWLEWRNILNKWLDDVVSKFKDSPDVIKKFKDMNAIYDAKANMLDNIKDLVKNKPWLMEKVSKVIKRRWWEAAALGWAGVLINEIIN